MSDSNQHSEVERLRDAIRRHRDFRGDDRCWMDDEDLYRVLPEGYIVPSRDSAVQIEKCKQFISRRQNPATVYVSPEREIEQLRNRLTAIRSKLREIVVTDGIDRGVVLLSQHGPTRWDEELQCHIYLYENFSPLGDALIELYEMTGNLTT